MGVEEEECVPEAPAQLEAMWPLWILGQENKRTSNHGVEGETQSIWLCKLQLPGKELHVSALWN